MQDTHGRTIEYLRLSVTDLCNLRCIYCMGEEGVEQKPHGAILRVEECIEIAEAAVALGIRKIRLTGGEPLVRRGILDIARGIGAIPGLQELCLTSNATLLPPYAAALREAGVSRLNLSLNALDSACYRTITRVGALEDALQGIRAAEEAGFTDIKLNVVLLNGINEAEIPALIALTKDKPYAVRFIELMPLGVSAPWHKERFLPADAVLEACPALVYTGRSGVAEHYQIPGHRGRVGLIRPMSRCFCGECNRIRVTADGMLKPCLHAEREIPLRGLHGEALQAAIAAGIEEKPLRHALEEGESAAGRTMNRIGG